jgi:hypothetical protein
LFNLEFQISHLCFCLIVVAKSQAVSKRMSGRSWRCNACRHRMNDLGSSQRVKSFQVLIFYRPLFAPRPYNSKPKRTDGRLLVMTPIDPTFLLIPILQVLSPVREALYRLPFRTMLTAYPRGMALPVSSSPWMIYSMKPRKRLSKVSMKVSQTIHHPSCRKIYCL